MSSAELFLSFLILLICLYKTNHVFRYFFKFFLYFIHTSFACVIFLPVFLLNPFDTGNIVIATSFLRYISYFVGIQWIVRGKEYLEIKKPCIVVSNHQSSIDIMGMYHIWKTMGKCTVICKNELLYVFPVGLLCWLGGLTFIKRSNPEQARADINEAALRIKKENIKLWVFPEGTRSSTGKMQDFKKGAFHTAVYAQLPILPVVFSHYYFLSSKEKKFDSGKVIVTALPPIPTEGMTTDDVEELMHKTKTLMESTFNETSKEIKQLENVTDHCTS